MSKIRSFRNADLPALAEIWVSHWSLIAPPPPVSATTIEQAILARTFFDASLLLVVEDEGRLNAWCHFVRQPEVDDSSGKTVNLCAICFAADRGGDERDELLSTFESRAAALGCDQIRVGPVRDVDCGYAGLAPIGHGIGVPSHDERTTSLLSRAGYSAQEEVVRMVAKTVPYRIPVNREVLQLRRTTQLRQQTAVASEPRRASAMSHLDVERQCLADQRSGKALANIDLWCSDPEAQVMSSSASILNLAGIHERGQMTPSEAYLVAATVHSLAERRVLVVETAVDRDHSTLLEQLKSLRFEATEFGHCWTKSL